MLFMDTGVFGMFFENYIYPHEISTFFVEGRPNCFLMVCFQKPNCFSTGNYYEVIYMSFKKNMHEKDIDVTKALFKCYPCFLPKLPLDVKVDDTLTK